MEFDDWEPWYRQIVDDLGLSMAEDALAGEELIKLSQGHHIIGTEEIRSLMSGTVTILGASRCLEADIEAYGVEGTMVVAGSAIDRVLRSDLSPDVLVTDLDGSSQAHIDCSATGTVLVIHAHGDNRDLMVDILPHIDGSIHLTMQACPVEGTHNYGGFTDGDRAAMMAAHFGSRHIRLLGFDTSEAVTYHGSAANKARKLRWADRLLAIIDQARRPVSIV